MIIENHTFRDKQFEGRRSAWSNVDEDAGALHDRQISTKCLWRT